MEYYRQGLIAMHRNGSNGHLLVCYYTQRIGEEGIHAAAEVDGSREPSDWLEVEYKNGIGLFFVNRVCNGCENHE